MRAINFLFNIRDQSSAHFLYLVKFFLLNSLLFFLNSRIFPKLQETGKSICWCWKSVRKSFMSINPSHFLSSHPAEGVKWLICGSSKVEPKLRKIKPAWWLPPRLCCHSHCRQLWNWPRPPKLVLDPWCSSASCGPFGMQESPRSRHICSTPCDHNHIWRRPQVHLDSRRRLWKRNLTLDS